MTVLTALQRDGLSGPAGWDDPDDRLNAVQVRQSETRGHVQMANPDTGPAPRPVPDPEANLGPALAPFQLRSTTLPCAPVLLPARTEICWLDSVSTCIIISLNTGNARAHSAPHRAPQGTCPSLPLGTYP